MVEELRYNEYVIVDHNVSVSPEGYEGTVLVDRPIWPPLTRLKKPFTIILYSIPLDVSRYGEAHILTPYLVEIHGKSTSMSVSGILGAIMVFSFPNAYNTAFLDRLVNSDLETYDKIRHGEYSGVLQSIYYRHKIKGYELF